MGEHSSAVLERATWSLAQEQNQGILRSLSVLLSPLIISWGHGSSLEVPGSITTIDVNAIHWGLR